jgi:hypothetical protein
LPSRVLAVLARLLGGLLPNCAASLARFAADIWGSARARREVGAFCRPRLRWRLLWEVCIRRSLCPILGAFCSRWRRWYGRQLDAPRDRFGADGVLGKEPNRDVEARIACILCLHGGGTR